MDTVPNSAQAQQQQERIVMIDGKNRRMKRCTKCGIEIYWTNERTGGVDKFVMHTEDTNVHNHPKPQTNARQQQSPLVFAFHVPSSSNPEMDREILEGVKKKNPNARLSRYEMSNGVGFYIFEERMQSGSG